MKRKNFQIAIIGGGIIGCSIARELSKYELDIAVFEMGSDVASDTSKANSGVIHSGINSPINSLKSRFCIEGNKMIQSLADDLNFPLKWVGKYIIAKTEEEINQIETLKITGEKNNIYGLEIKNKSEVNKEEPNVLCNKALYVPNAGITLPYEFTIALAENAVINNVKFFLETKVNDLRKKKENFLISTNRGNFKSDILVNAAGLNCRKIVSMIEKPDFQIYPCRGEYLVLDNTYCNIVKSMIYNAPAKGSGVLGVHITPTIEGNILLGPSAEYIDNYNDKMTTNTMMNKIIKEARQIIPILPNNAVINAYSGIRCKLAPPELGGWADYRIEYSKNTDGLINLLGIESPGLTAAPAIAKEISKMLSILIKLKRKNNFKSRRKRIKNFSDMSIEEKTKLIKKNENWGRIICRCESVSEAEVINALSNPLGAKTLSSVKYRCRAGMGRCQGGFCTQHITRIMKDHFKIDINDIKLKSPKSYLFYGKTRDDQID
jgi:glycerol-3-phosphate dehydrogenase